MSGENKFFFEEDIEEEDKPAGELTAKDQADIFGSIVGEVGISSSIESMAPIGVVADAIQMNTLKDNLITLEYGIVQNNYTLHITPIHQRRNLINTNKMNEAIKSVILSMNKKVPYELKVAIHLPQEDWEIKALSFVIEGGASAWNFNIAEFEEEIIPEIFKSVSNICMVL